MDLVFPVFTDRGVYARDKSTGALAQYSVAKHYCLIPLSQ